VGTWVVLAGAAVLLAGLALLAGPANRADV
jgi:hypothetical protein